MEDVPVLDLADDRATCVATLDKALQRFGFFYLRSHGVDTAPQFAAARALFDLPAAAKTKMPFDAQLDVGYVGGGVQSLNPDGSVQASGDTKEQFMMTNNQLITQQSSTDNGASTTTDPENVFEGSFNYTPPVPDYRVTTSAYASALFRLNQRLNSLLFEALKLDHSVQDTLGREPFVVLKQMRYAPDPSDVSKGKFGAGARKLVLTSFPSFFSPAHTRTHTHTHTHTHTLILFIPSILAPP
jgi:isopenicillin N synthase-like dioxygenase